MARKNKVYKKKGIKVVEAITKKEERALFPRPVVFRDKTKYTRKQKHRASFDA